MESIFQSDYPADPAVTITHDALSSTQPLPAFANMNKSSSFKISYEKPFPLIHLVAQDELTDMLLTSCLT